MNSRNYRLLMVLTVCVSVLWVSPRQVVGTSDRIDSAPVRPSLVQNAQQLIVVQSETVRSTRAVVTGYDLVTRDGQELWKQTLGPYQARLGRSGVSLRHREGDGTTPQGSWGLISIFGLGVEPNVLMPYRQVKPGDCWVSDGRSVRYNMYSTGKWCLGNSENLWSIAKNGPYVLSVVTDYNVNPVVKNQGSAIFIHRHSYAKSGKTRPTSGCVSVDQNAITKISHWLDATRYPRIVVGTKAWLRK
jgi:L,D-peptidoglycan transpeptidase YkuD (ErfK/YbiS/YcfS/YnhG family)